MQLLADILLGEVGHRDVELVAHVPPQRAEHLLVEGMPVLLLHIPLRGAEPLHGDLVGPLAPHEGDVLRFADLLAQRHVDHREKRQHT